MIIYDLYKNCFTTYTNQPYFLAIQIDQERDDFKEVIHIFDKETPLILPLNNEDDTNLDWCLELFSNEDKNFIMLLDYYRFDNKHLITEIFEL